MKDLFFFDSMITPKIITFVYWLILFLVVVAGVGIMFSGYGFSFEMFFTGLFTILGGAIGARIWCELMIVLFKIHENTKIIADNSHAAKSAE